MTHLILHNPMAAGRRPPPALAAPAKHTQIRRGLPWHVIDIGYPAILQAKPHPHPHTCTTGDLTDLSISATQRNRIGKSYR